MFCFKTKKDCVISVLGEDSESDPDFDESEESDEDFGVRRGKETKKKPVQKKPKAEKKERKSKPKREEASGEPALKPIVLQGRVGSVRFPDLRLCPLTFC